MNKIIEATNLRKNYGDIAAVKDISFYVEQGKLFSFLGPNGAGKSTTIDTLCTLIDFDGGEASICGFDLRRESQAIVKIIGVVFQDSVLDSLLTVRENLMCRASLYISDKAKIKNAVCDAAAATKLDEFIDRPFGKLSGGQRRRADIARALLHAPKILFLDEPTTGLDPQTRKSIWDTIRDLQRRLGMTVFLTTHYMEEAAASDYITVIDHGEIAARGTPAELKTRYTSDILRMTSADFEGLASALNGMSVAYEKHPNEIVVKLGNTMESLAVLDTCREYITSFQVLQGTMDDAFIGITGKELRS